MKNMLSKFEKKLNWKWLSKSKIDTLQINLWRKCNLSCSHCHVEAGPNRTEELENSALQNILKILEKFPQIKVVDLTGWAPEMNNWFKEIVKFATSLWKKVIVRSNLTIFFEEWFEWIPAFLKENKVEIVASLPCYLKDNVDKMRGFWVFDKSIKALQILNKLWFWIKNWLNLNLVFNPALPNSKENFSLAPNQENLWKSYKKFLKENFEISFTKLFTFTNLPCGKYKKYLERKKLYWDYIDFLDLNFNSKTLSNLMCKTQLSVDYLWNIFDCDFNQVEFVNSISKSWKKVNLDLILEENNLDLIENIWIKDYCFGCTAWAGSSCWWNLT